MIILGLDVGLRNTGWGIVKVSSNNKLKCISYGLVQPKATLPLEQRLSHLWAAVSNILQMYSPDQVAIEQTFFGLNASSCIRLGAAYGTIISTAGLAKIPVFAYPTKVIKLQIAEKGDASKEEIAIATCKTLQIEEINQEDTTDALATALCHINMHIFRSEAEKADDIEKQKLAKKKKKEKREKKAMLANAEKLVEKVEAKKVSKKVIKKKSAIVIEAKAKKIDDNQSISASNIQDIPIEIMKKKASKAVSKKQKVNI